MKKTNLFELFATITLDDSEYNRGLENAGKATSKFGGMLKTGLAAAAKAATAALAAAAAGVAALTKASLESYAEYEQLVGGIETLFKDSSDKVREYAANAYKTAGMSANEYMQTVTSFSASLINSLATTTEEATGAVTTATIDSLNEQLEAMQKTQDENVEAVERANEKEIELIEESYEKQLEDFEKLTEERIKLIDKQYAENLKLVDEEEYRRLQAIQNEIDAINAQQAADDKAAKQREENEKKFRLQSEINNAKTFEERQQAQQELNDYLAKLEAERVEESRKARIAELKDEKDAIKSEADEKRKALKEQRDKEVKIIRESADIELKERKKAQDKYLKSLKDSHAAELKAIKDSNKEKLDAMRDYIAEQSKLVTDGTVQVKNITAETYEEAAEIADMAITDMADNANKMGSTMESIQNAYQGFAKQNYTMLDNLKLGYGGTKEEMERLLADAEKIAGVEFDISSYADVVKAIHEIQKEMDITGATAKEAGTTIQGSVNSMKAAWENLVTGLGDENADIGQLFDDLIVTIVGDGTDTNLGVLGTVIPRVKIIFEKLTGAIKDKLAEVDWKAEGEKLINLLAEGIETASDIALKVQEKIDQTDWYAVGQKIGKAIAEGLDLVEAIGEAIKNTDWEQLGKDMAQYLINSFQKNVRANLLMWGGITGNEDAANASVNRLNRGVAKFSNTIGFEDTLLTTDEGNFFVDNDQFLTTSSRTGGKGRGASGRGGARAVENINIVENIYVQGDYDDAAQRRNNAQLANTLAR
ncbi:MAG: hypothetical protein U0K91_11000 [Acutalibacteraceae bacterium]|nr:hypothetical protein [Acutalibacteraceae bacterium]